MLEGDAMYTMKEMTELIGVSDTTLKRYEARGLVPPISRTAGGQRRYNERHLQGFKAIRALLQGFATKDVDQLMQWAGQRNFSAAHWLIAENQKLLVDQRDQLARNRQFILQLPEKRIIKDKLRIGELAEFAQVEASAIRYWEQRGLLSSERAENGYRYFSKNEIRKALIIPFLRKTVYQVEAIKKILAGIDQEDFANIRHHYETTAQKNDEYLLKQLIGIKEFQLYCDLLTSPSS